MNPEHIIFQKIKLFQIYSRKLFKKLDNDLNYLNNLEFIYLYLNILVDAHIIVQTGPSVFATLQQYDYKLRKLKIIRGNNPFKFKPLNRLVENTKIKFQDQDGNIIIKRQICPTNLPSASTTASATGNIPSTTGNIPSTTGNIPSTTGNILFTGFIHYKNSEGIPQLDTIYYVFNFAKKKFINLDIYPLNGWRIAIISTVVLPSGCLVCFCRTGRIFSSLLSIIGCQEWSDNEMQDFKSSWTQLDYTNQKFRSDFSAIVLQDGNVLISGGCHPLERYKDDIYNTVEIYNPINNTFKTVASLLTKRKNHTSILLPNGRVFIMGGIKSNGLTTATCEEYNPSTDKWIYKKKMEYNRCNHKSILIDPNTILVMNGICITNKNKNISNHGFGVERNEYYNIITDTWSEGPYNIRVKSSSQDYSDSTRKNITGLKRKNN